MKNYKAEIEKILNDVFYSQSEDGAEYLSLEDDANTILSLIREIVQEAIGENDIYKIGSNVLLEEIEHTRNKFRSEILSNIEEMIK